MPPRTKYTPPRYKFVPPEVTDEMIDNFKRSPGRPLKNKDIERQMIKMLIVEQIVNEREVAWQRRMAERRKVREEQERQQLEEKRRLEEEVRVANEQAKRDRREEREERERMAQVMIEHERISREQIEMDRIYERQMERERREHERLARERREWQRLIDEREAEAQQVRLREYQVEYQRRYEQMLVERRAGIAQYGEEEWYRMVRARDRKKRLEEQREQLIQAKAQTRRLLNKPDPKFEYRLFTLRRQLTDPEMVARFEKFSECPKYRERNRGSALEMQRMIELYDMIEEDWALDALADDNMVENRVTTTTPPCDANEPTFLATVLPGEQPKYWQYYIDKVNDMINPDYNTLLARFGSKPYYRWMFTGRETYNPVETFNQLEASKKHNETDYEVARQKFLQILGFHTGVWYKTSPRNDIGIEISKVYRKKLQEYIAFMRIRCGGRRDETYCPSQMRIVFHLLLGRVSFNLNKRSRVMSRGSNIIVDPGSTYAINCLERNQAAYFVFSITYLRLPDRPKRHPELFTLIAEP